MKDFIIAFLKSMMQRGMIAGLLFALLEKWVILILATQIHWSILCFVIWKDIMTLTILGRISWEKIKLSATISK